jgi:hypothetical protein
MNPARWRRWALRHARPATGLLIVLWLLSVLAALSARSRAAGQTGALLLVVILVLWSVWVRWQRERAVREAVLPQFLKRKLRETYPQLSGKDCDLVERGLRQFFWACLRSNRKFVAMPSKAVDAMWHEFILHTRAYRDWCDLTLGWFLHHTPAEALGPAAKGNDGLRRAWYWACRDESINPRQPTRLPLLFALDAKLEIAGGFRYQPDCRDIRRKSDQGGDGSGGTYCATDFSDGSHSGDADGLGGVDGSGDGGGDGGGCGGGGD